MNLPQKYNLTKYFVQKVTYLLKKTHIPHVQVRTSQLQGAGNGVFITQSINDDQLPLPVCLYAGVYTPGMPSALMVDDAASDMVGGQHLYYGDRMLPSQVPKDESGYVMNLQNVPTGGYLDGMCLEVILADGDSGERSRRRRLDINPSACGHLVNHDASNANTEFVGFSWDDLLLQVTPTFEHYQQQKEKKDDGSTEEEDLYYDLPNEWRKDGSPWYFDGFMQELQRFPDSSSGKSPGFGCGGVIVVTKPVAEGEELFLDYKLNKPYPAWAQGWYKGASDR